MPLVKGYYSLADSYPQQLEPGSEDEFAVGLYDTDGGCRYEFIVEVSELGSGRAAQVKIFNDAFQAFDTDIDLFRALRAMETPNPTSRDIREVLDRCGYKDLTRQPPERACCPVCGSNRSERPSDPVDKEPK
jgi:hypothetical protein